MRTRIYVDAFNLYYGALRGTPYRWLDLDALCRHLLRPTNIIDHIHYCTAPVAARPNDPRQPQRQRLYLRALATIPHVTVTLGRFLTSDVFMPRAPPAPDAYRPVLVRKTEEKGSDVNLAALLLRDGFLGLYDVAVVISNDSDLVLPVQVVQADLGKPVGVFNPHKKPSFHLRQCASFYRPIRAGALRASQFPATLTDRHGTFTKPDGW